MPFRYHPAMTARTVRLRDRKQDFVRSEIWHAAVDLFARRGYEATTVEEIAAAAGVSRRTFFRYYASKDDLMVKAIDTYGDLLSDAIRTAAPNAAPLDLIKQAVLRVAQEIVAHPRVRDTMSITMKSPAARRAQLSELEVVTDRLSREFARLLRRDRGREYVAWLMASMTISVLTQTFRTWYERQPPRVDDIVDEILASLTTLLTIESPRARTAIAAGRAYIGNTRGATVRRGSRTGRTG
jgi:AcrR family transcriptional regulator